MSDSSVTTRLAAFHAAREEQAVAPQGPLALVNTQWVDSEQTIWGVPGRWAPAEGGLAVSAAASAGIVVDGALVDGTVLARGEDQPGPSEITFGDTMRGTVIVGERGNHALQVWDALADGIREFGSIDAYPYNPEWVITATRTANPDGTTAIAFTKDGLDYELVAEAAGEQLKLVYSDATSGADTYSVGRFLFAAPGSDGSVTLDFNFSELPPCAFSYNFSCPIPPQQNRLTIAVEAGEKNVLARSGALLHAF
jgi:uncharacterized protein (DUF1684 family)